MKCFLLCWMLAIPAFGADQSDELTNDQVADYTGNKPQPPALKDATIQVQTKGGGTKYDFSANTHKVVSRESSSRVQDLIDNLRKQLAACEDKLAPAPAPAPAPVFKKHTIGLLIGHDNIEIEKNGLIFGGQYAYHLDDVWSLSGMAISNKSVLAGAGYSFADAHTISLLIGHAKQNSDIEAVKNKGLIFGGQYAYHLDDVWSLSATMTSNKSVLAGAGYSFNL